jgi:Protein of unknown function (DUF4239)
MGGGIPFWLLLVCVVAVALLIAVGGILLANRILSSTGEGHNATLSPFTTIVGLVNGVLLGFTVVVAWQQFSSAQVVVANEASTLTTMYRLTVAMPAPEQAQMKQLLREYASAVVGPEWGTQGGGGSSDSARSALTGMYRVIAGQPRDAASSEIDHVFLGQLTVLASDRTTRMIDAKPRIPSLLWLGLIFGGSVLVTLMGFLRLGSTVGHALVSGTIAALIGLLLSIAFSLDHPFGMELGISSAPFQHALEVFDAVDRGT